LGIQAGDGRQQGRGVGIASVQRQAEIKQDARSVARKFDAGAADLLRSPMNANAESIVLGADLAAVAIPDGFWLQNLYSRSPSQNLKLQ
jgi:hypothetical protein